MINRKVYEDNNEGIASNIYCSKINSAEHIQRKCLQSNCIQFKIHELYSVGFISLS